ncbi:MAG: GIY-YIG nuclease family protein [Candidatus Hadarchaeales archaeon]
MRSGVYVLLIHVPYSFSTKVGELGNIEFEQGYYAYIGSAMGGLEKRVGRHMKGEKKLHWHIDYLLLHSRPVDVFIAETNEKCECKIAEELCRRFSSIEGFGSSDCGCKSHLVYSKDPNELTKSVISAFKNAGLKLEKRDRYG